MKRKLHEPKRKPSRAAPRTGRGAPARRPARAAPTPQSVEADNLAAIPVPATGRAIPPREAQEALRESEKRYRSLFENMTEGFAYCRMLFEDGRPRDFVYLAVNNAFQTLTGLKDVVGKRVSQVIPGIREADPELFERYARVALTGKPERFEIYVTALKMWFFISVYCPMKEHFVAVFDVITERKQTEEALRASEVRYRVLTELSSDLYWEQDENQRFTRLSQLTMGHEEIDANIFLGRTRREVPGFRWDEPELAALEAIMEARQPFRDFEIGRTYLDGPKHYVQISGEPMFDARGRYIGYRGVGKGITERRRAEDELKRRNEDLQRVRAAMDATVNAIYLVDRASMRFIDVNEAACRMQSRSRDELLALEPERVLSTSREELERIYDAVIAGGAATEPLEMPRRRKDGSEAWVELRRSARRSGEGWMILTVVRDITAQKQAEQTIRYRTVQQSLIASFGQQALASADIDDLLAQAVVVVTEGLAVGWCKILLLAPDARSLILKAGCGWEAGWMGRSITEIDAGAQNRFVLDAGEPVVVEDLARETRFAPSAILTAHGIRSGVDVPIGGAGGWFGILGVYAPEQRRFSPDSVNFLRGVANIIQTAVERKRAEEKLAYLAQFDALTGLPNRNLFLDRLAQMLTQAQRNGSLAGVMFVDLDRFKAVNDTYGHGAGDKLLRLVAERLKECVRSGDTVGRLGGDEFAIALSTLGKADDASLVAQKVVDALARPFDLDGHIIYMTASLGVALYPSDGADADGLLKNADIAMYRAKEHGRNVYQFYLPQMNERAEKRLQMEIDLRGALERNEFLLHYQPKVNLASGEISGFEALLRWRHPERGLAPPLDFISILEDTGLIVPVGEWVVRTACEQLRRWRAEGVAPRPIAVNLSARQFREKDLDAVIGRILRDTGADPFLLEFELTESLLMNDPEDAVRTLKKMKAYGVRLSVDDFGTGYSSLAYLKRFPLDALKIDRAFVRDVTADPDDATITLTIVNLAHSLRLKVVAEGVETEAQLNFLRAHGCDEMQGYFFARPLPAADCTRMLIEDRHLQSPPLTEPPDATVLLLVDDNDEYLATLKQVLAPGGYRILCAGDAEAGFDVLAKHPVQIVISDYRMPRMTGVEFLARVRGLYPHAVRIVVSGVGDMGTVIDAVNEAGIHKYLSKTWGVARVQAEVREAYLRHRKAPE